MTQPAIHPDFSTGLHLKRINKAYEVILRNYVQGNTPSEQEQEILQAPHELYYPLTDTRSAFAREAHVVPTTLGHYIPDTKQAVQVGAASSIPVHVVLMSYELPPGVESDELLDYLSIAANLDIAKIVDAHCFDRNINLPPYIRYPGNPDFNKSTGMLGDIIHNSAILEDTLHHGHTINTRDPHDIYHHMKVLSDKTGDAHMKWYMNIATADMLGRLRSPNGRYIIMPKQLRHWHGPFIPEEILGRKVVINQMMHGLDRDPSHGCFPIMLADMSGYCIPQHANIKIRRFEAEQDRTTITFLVRFRIGGDVVDPKKIHLMKMDDRSTR